MPARDLIPARATVIAVLREGACRVQLANGHTCIARPVKGLKLEPAVDDQVSLEFHPYDLSRARILG